MWGCFGSLRNKSHSDRREPRWGCCQFTGKSEKRGPWRQGQGVSLGRAFCPLFPWLQVLWGRLEVRRCSHVEEKEGEGKGMGGLLRERECTAGSFVLRGWNPASLGKVLGEGLSRMLISFMLMCQNETFSLNFFCPWVWLAQMTIIWFLLGWFKLFTLWLGKRSVNHLLLSVLG